MLEGASVEDITGLLNVDLEFGGDWGYSAVPWSEPDEESLNQLEACSIVGFLSDEVGSNRLEDLEHLAEEIDAELKRNSKSITERLGLSKVEIEHAINGMREDILCGDTGWDHCAAQSLEGHNGWEIVFVIIYNEVDKNASFEVRPIDDAELLQEMLVKQLLSRKDSILDSLNFALSRAREAGGTAGHMHGSRLRGFESLIEIAELIQRSSKRS
jgi:hypothetical protein